MIYVYEILSGEEWNGQSKPEDFKETKLVAEFKTFSEFEESEYYDRENIVYEKSEN